MTAASISILLSLSDAMFADRLRQSLGRAGYHVEAIDSATDPESALSGAHHDVVIISEDLAWDRRRSLEGAVKALRTHAAVIVMAAQGSVGKAVAAIRAGAADYLLQGVSEEMLCASVHRAGASRRRSGSGPAEKEKPVERPIVFRSAVMNRLLATAARVAPSPASVLIQGESGTGKEMLARFIHWQSDRAGKPFVAMNCAALPDNLAESELFGYEKGAFTGAVQSKPGKFESARGGTLLLDEIGEMAIGLQAKLLRALQEKEVDRLGGGGPLHVDVRVIATTNCDLGLMVREGRFRMDLYHRLRVIPLQMPPLRDRREDIALLIAHFLEKFAASGCGDGSADGREPVLIDAAAIDVLTHWDWPGNVRELENTIQRALLIGDGVRIRPDDLLLEGERAGISVADNHVMPGTKVREMEKRLIQDTLAHVNQNRTLAAEMLGISIRTLRNKLREYREGCMCNTPAGGR